jgi:ribonucleotide reductase beta subunit family protein with ferritin-like domain
VAATLKKIAATFFNLKRYFMRLLTPKSTYTIDYPQSIEYVENQMDAFWLPTEIEVEKDLHDLKTNFTEAESHGVITTLKLFTLYELIVGDEYWNNVVGHFFQRPDIQRMASCFSFFELNVHAPFYDKLNKVLGLSTDEFYNSYAKDPILKERISWIGKKLEKIDKNNPISLLKSIGTFSMVEGAILYSSFAFLKHFQAEGKNKLINVNAGINFSVKDENLHSEAGAWLFRTLLQESKEEGSISENNLKGLEVFFQETVQEVYEHECRIIEMIFEKGPIKGITDLQLKNFVESRLDLCLENLGYEKYFKPTYNPIAKWFYKNIGMGQLHDFFYKQGNQYTRDWVETKFVW